MLRWFEHSQVYHPQRELECSAADLGRPWEDLRFAASDGVEIHAWYFPADAGSQRVDKAILICHGNAGNVSFQLGLVQALLQTGVNVMVFDYRGYGRSAGTPSEEGTYLDAQAAYRWLRARGFAPEHIIVFGESLGGGVATELCIRETTGGLILLSTFTSIPDVGAELFWWLPVRLLARIKYATRSKLPRLRVPVLVMHGKEDGLVGFHHAERNFAAAHEPKLFRELAGDHNNCHDDRAGFVAAVESLLQLVESLKPGKESR